MSIVKNTLEPDTAVTIKRFPKNTNRVSCLTLPSAYTSVVAKLYLQLNNKAVGDKTGAQPDIFRLEHGASVFLKAQLGPYAGGPFFGGTSGTNNNVMIWKFYDGDDYYIRWYVDAADQNDYIAQVPYTNDGLPHIYGWLSVDDNGTKKIQPWYDGAVVPSSSAVTYTESPRIFLGGMYTGQGQAPTCIYSSGSGADYYGIRIYEAISEGPSGSWHLYACQYTKSGTTYNGMFDTRNRSQNIRVKEVNVGSTQSSVTAADSVGDFPDQGYGVQLHDVKYITGSSYNDLMAIMADDGGIDTRAGWSNTTAATSYKLTRTSDSAQLPFAFWLGGSSQSGRVPIPSGYSYPSGSSYAVGELMLGRTPKWSIWNDAIKFGFYIDNSDAANNRYYLKYNFLKMIDVSSSGAPHQSTVTIGSQLKYFEDYNTAESSIHAPRILYTNTNLDCYIYNGAFSRCLNEDIMAGNMNYSTWCDSNSVFKFNNSVGGNINYRIGNMAPWNFTATEIGYYGLHITGAKFSVQFDGSDVEYFADTYPATPNVTLCADTDATIKETLRVTGRDVTLTINDDTKWRLLERLTDAQGHTLNMVGKLQLILNSNTNAKIDTSNVFNNNKSFAVQGHFDEKVKSNASGYRMIVDFSDEIDQSTSQMCIVGRNPNFAPSALDTKFVSTGSYHYSSVFLPVMRCTEYHGEPYPEYESVDPEVTLTGYETLKAFVEVYRKYTPTSGPVEYYHYTILVNSINGITAFKRYCDNGDPSANSPISIGGTSYWPGMTDLFLQCWTTTDLTPTASLSQKMQCGWKDGVSGRFPYFDITPTTETPNDFRKLVASTRVFLVPRNTLYGALSSPTAPEFGDDMTVIMHVYPSTTTKMFSSFCGTTSHFNGTTYQKYIHIASFPVWINNAATTEPIWFVSTQPYYTFTNGSNVKITFTYRTYTYSGGAYVRVPDIRDICYGTATAGSSTYTGVFCARLYRRNGTIDYSAAAAPTDIDNPEYGDLVARFIIDDSSSLPNDIDGRGYSYGYSAVVAQSNVGFFHKWGTEADNSPFERITITKSGGFANGTLYCLEIYGNQPADWNSIIPIIS